MRLSCDNLQWILVFSSSNICPVLCSIMLIPDTGRAEDYADTLVPLFTKESFGSSFAAQILLWFVVEQ